MVGKENLEKTPGRRLWPCKFSKTKNFSLAFPSCTVNYTRTRRYYPARFKSRPTRRITRPIGTRPRPIVCPAAGEDRRVVRSPCERLRGGGTRVG